MQVIYWGDLPAHAANKCMNYLAYRLVDYYLEKGMRVIDVGPSTEKALPITGYAVLKKASAARFTPKLPGV